MGCVFGGSGGCVQQLSFANSLPLLEHSPKSSPPCSRTPADCPCPPCRPQARAPQTRCISRCTSRRGRCCWRTSSTTARAWRAWGTPRKRRRTAGALLLVLVVSVGGGGAGLVSLDANVCTCCPYQQHRLCGCVLWEVLWEHQAMHLKAREACLPPHGPARSRLQAPPAGAAAQPVSDCAWCSA